MKKVLFLALWFLPQIGGMEMSSYEIVKALRYQGNEVCVLTSDHVDKDLFDSKQDFPIFRIKGMFLSKLADDDKIRQAYWYIRYYTSAYHEMKHVLQKFQPDEIIIADEQTRNWYGFYANKLKLSPTVIVSMPEKKPSSFKQKMKIRYVMKTFDVAKRIICVSNSTKNMLISTFGKSIEGKIQIIYRSIDDRYIHQTVDPVIVTSIREKYGLNEKTVLLSVCRLNERKGLLVAYEAVKKVLYTNATIAWIIIGTGPIGNILQEKINADGFEKQIFLCGKLPNTDVIHYYDTCDIFLLPSKEESFGRVFVEAGSRGKPSIAGGVGGVFEVIDTMQNGILVDPNSQEEILQALQKLIHRTELRLKLGDAIHAKVINNYSFDVLCQQFASVFI